MKLRREKSFLLWAGVWALAVFAPACGSDGNGDGSQALCVVEELEAGAYSFSVQSVKDGCAGGALADIIGEGPYQVELPSFAELQQGPVLVDADLPGVGNVTVQLALEGEVVRLSMPDGDVSVQIFEGCTAVAGATGTLCPVSMSQVNATLVLRLEDLVGAACAILPVVTPCSATVGLRGVQ